MSLDLNNLKFRTTFIRKRSRMVIVAITTMLHFGTLTSAAFLDQTQTSQTILSYSCFSRRLNRLMDFYRLFISSKQFAEEFKNSFYLVDFVTDCDNVLLDVMT